MEQEIISLLKKNPDFLNEIKNCKKENLISYHNSLGRDIRNYFKLWDTEWTPEIVNCVDISENHPDAISMKLIENVWSILQND
jgi:hypothetical protein